MSKKRKSIFAIFDEISANFVDGVREGLENFNNLIGSVVEYMELAGNIDTVDMIEKNLKKIEIESEDSEEDEEENIINSKI